MKIKKRNIKPNQLVIFPKYFKINGMRVNAVFQQDDGVMMFVDSERYTFKTWYMEGFTKSL